MILDPLHGVGYQFWSGIGGNLSILGATLTLLLKHNCYTRGCLRVGRIRCEDGHIRCGRHAH